MCSFFFAHTAAGSDPCDHLFALCAKISRPPPPFSLDVRARARAGAAAGAANAITAAIESQAFQEIAPAQETLAGTCQACHGEYRERVDGNARIKPGVL